MRYTGLSEVIGSWKIIAISLPRTLRISSSGMVMSDLPLKMTSPPSTLPGGIGMSFIIVRACTDLPDPDSPTTPSVSPQSRS